MWRLSGASLKNFILSGRETHNVHTYKLLAVNLTKLININFFTLKLTKFISLFGHETYKVYKLNFL